MKQLNPHHQASSPKDLPHTLQGSQGASSDNYPEPKTAEAEDDSVFSEEEEKEKPHNDQLVVLPTKSWGPSCIKVKIPEPVFMATQHPEEDQKQGVGPKALTGAGLMVHGIHCEVGPHPKKTPKNKALGTPKGGPKPKDPPTMGQLLEMFEKNLRRISSLCDFICQKPTLSILDQKSPRATRNNTHQTVQKKTKRCLFSKHEIWAPGPMVKPWFQPQNLLPPKATLKIQTPFIKPLPKTQGVGPLSTMHFTQPLGGSKWSLASKRGGEGAPSVHSGKGHPSCGPLRNLCPASGPCWNQL